MIRYGTPAARGVILAAVGGSGIVFLDGTVVNLALPAMGADLDATFAGLQWVVTAYLVTLSSLILFGGSLGDLYGRRRIFIVGTVWFAVASVLCAVAPTTFVLIAARALQGIGGALLTPASLAIIQASFHPDDRSRAIGAWSGLSGVAAAVGPFLGGWLVDAVSWRAIFIINVPLTVVVVVAALRFIPESSDATRAGWHPDVAGGLFAALALAGLTFALIEAPSRGAGPFVWTAAGVAVAGFVGFAVTEMRERHPMLPLAIFRSLRFTGANIATFLVYGALGVFFFLFAINLQSALGYSPLEAGAAGLPVTVLMLAFSARAGQLAQHIGPRIPMTVGPLVMAVGLLLARRIVPGSSFFSAVLPPVVVFGIGLVILVAPLTATVLAAADVRHAGVASGVNNAVARAGGMLAVAVVPVVAGLGGADLPTGTTLAAGVATGMTWAAGAVALGGVVSWITVGKELTPAPALASEHHCSVTAPPDRPPESDWGSREPG